MAGHLVMAEARARAAEVAETSPDDAMASPLAWLRPIDSEHSAIWQCLVGEPMAGVERLVLTASGGPFLDAPEDLAAVTPEQALRHPTWRMGAKITIDSATLANKGLEVIEAHWLYDVSYDAIDVVIHPQSVVHSAVRFVDGSLKAQLGTPDMRLPIQYALTHPDRMPSPAPPPTSWPRPARLPGARRGAVPGAAHRPRRGPRGPPRVGGADRRRRGRGRPLPRRLPRLPGYPAAARGCGRAVRGRRRTRPDLDELVALDAEVRAAFATGPSGRRADGAHPVAHHDRPLHRDARRARARPRARPLPHRAAGDVRVLEFGIGFPPRAKVLAERRDALHPELAADRRLRPARGRGRRRRRRSALVRARAADEAASSSSPASR